MELGIFYVDIKMYHVVEAQQYTLPLNNRVHLFYGPIQFPCYKDKLIFFSHFVGFYPY